jgi:hypothetical protein
MFLFYSAGAEVSAAKGWWHHLYRYGDMQYSVSFRKRCQNTFAFAGNLSVPGISLSTTQRIRQGPPYINWMRIRILLRIRAFSQCGLRTVNKTKKTTGWRLNFYKRWTKALCKAFSLGISLQSQARISCNTILLYDGIFLRFWSHLHAFAHLGIDRHFDYETGYGIHNIIGVSIQFIFLDFC